MGALCHRGFLAVAAFPGHSLDLSGGIRQGRVQDAAGDRSPGPPHWPPDRQPRAGAAAGEFMSLSVQVDRAGLSGWRAGSRADFFVVRSPVLTAVDGSARPAIILRFNFISAAAAGSDGAG